MCDFDKIKPLQNVWNEKYAHFHTNDFPKSYLLLVSDWKRSSLTRQIQLFGRKNKLYTSYYSKQSILCLEICCFSLNLEKCYFVVLLNFCFWFVCCCIKYLVLNMSELQSNIMSQNSSVVCALVKSTQLLLLFIYSKVIVILLDKVNSKEKKQKIRRM